MFPVAVRAFDLQVVNLPNALRIAQDVVVTAAEVAAEQKAVRAASVANIERVLKLYIGLFLSKLAPVCDRFLVADKGK